MEKRGEVWKPSPALGGGPLPSEWEREEEKIGEEREEKEKEEEKEEEKKDPLRPLRGHLPRQDGGGARKMS